MKEYYAQLILNAYFSREKSIKSAKEIYSHFFQREREDLDHGLFIALVPKFYNNVFLFVGFTTLETLIDFDWLVY